MLKQHEYSFSLLQKLTDAVFVLIFWYLAYILRFNLNSGAQVGLEGLFMKISPLVALLTLYFFRKDGLYRSQRFNSRFKEIATVLKANAQAILTLVIILYFFAPDRVSRLTLLYYFVISQLGLVSIRLLVRNYLRMLRRKGHNLRHVLLVGNSEELIKYVHAIRSFKDSGINFKGWLEGGDLPAKLGIEAFSGTLSEVKEQIHPDSIVIGFSAENGSKVKEIIRSHHNDVTPLQILPDVSYSFIGHEIEDFEGLPVITMNQPHLDSFDFLIKRCFDIILTAPALIILSPIYALLAIGVRLSSPGPIFYGQERMSLDGKSFLMWKFRSMRTDSEAGVNPGWTVANDPRKTKFGSFIRKTSLDELPQIWNVFKGDMSLVGPRPERPFYVEKFRHEIPAYMLRHKMKTGITGWAQVNGWRGDTSLERRIECDLWYIKNWSLWLDIKIIFLTFWKGFINKNAY